MMNRIETLSHVKWECKYHIIWISKYRRKNLYGQLRKELGKLLRQLASHKECQVEEGHLMCDHFHMMVSIPPKYSVSHIVGYIKGKSVIYISRNFLGRRQNVVGQHFWARGYYVSTVGRDEKTIREYIRNQEKEDQRVDQLGLFK